MRHALRFLAVLISSLLISGAALANTCDNFASFSCPTNSKGKTINDPNVVNLVGTGSTGTSVGILLGSDTFGIKVNGKSFVGDDLVIVAAFPDGMGGKVNGTSFTSLNAFAEGDAIASHNHNWTGAIPTTWNAWQGKGVQYTFSSVAFGYANLGLIGAGPISVTASGVPNGTVFYAEIINPVNKQILYITPNSEAGLLDAPTSPVPEPGTLVLFGSGLVGLGTVMRRKLRL